MPDVAPSPALLRFAERQSRIARVTERRTEGRHFIAQPVSVQFLDANRQPIGEPHVAVTRAISPSGIGLLFEGATEHDLATVRLNIDGEEVHLLVEIRWRRLMEPFEYAGGQVLRELDGSP